MADRLPIASSLPLGVLRIVSGLLFLEHGTQKFLSFPAGQYAGIGWGFDNPAAFAGIIELVCGLLITLGLFTRVAALLASGTMAIGYWTIHAPNSLFPIQNGGEIAALFCFIFLYIFFAGPGAWNLGGLLSRRRADERAEQRAVARATEREARH
jgi:putative oxidoreductase